MVVGAGNKVESAHDHDRAATVGDDWLVTGGSSRATR